jgi:hypothetical protein
MAFLKKHGGDDVLARVLAYMLVISHFTFTITHSMKKTEGNMS